MLVQVLGLAQVSFRLQVRKEDLALISMKRVDGLTKLMDTVQNLITERGYSVTIQMTLDGVVT